MRHLQVMNTGMYSKQSLFSSGVHSYAYKMRFGYVCYVCRFEEIVQVTKFKKYKSWHSNENEYWWKFLSFLTPILSNKLCVHFTKDPIKMQFSNFYMIFQLWTWRIIIFLMCKTKPNKPCTIELEQKMHIWFLVASLLYV